MNERLSNTEIFNNELKNNCNCEKLLKIASKGIFLQEPLFNHPKLKYTEHVIEISILSNQFYIIRNKKQYNKFIELYKHKKNYLTYPCDDGYVFRNLILNKYVIKQLSKENNDIYSSIVNEFDMSEIMILLCFFYKYDFISLNVFNLFKNISDYYEITDDVYMIMELFNFFYIDNKLNDINILNINLLYQKIKQSTGKTEINFENLLYLVVQNFGRDINILKYISENCKYTYSTECIDMFRLPLLNHPLNVLMKYSCKLFKQNKYYLKHNNKNIELFVNAIFSDFGLKCINFFCGYPNDCFNVYDISLINEECENFDLYINNKNSTIIDISNNNNDNNNNDDNNNDNNNNDNNNNDDNNNDDNVHCVNHNQLINNNNINNNFKDSDNFYNNYNVNIKSNNITNKINKTFINYKYYNFIFKEHRKYFNKNHYNDIYKTSIAKECILFYETFLNTYKKIEKILNNPYYIIDALVDYYSISTFKNFAVLCYIASLIHNNKSNFLIYILIYIYDAKINFISFKNNKICFKIDLCTSNLFLIYCTLSKTKHKIFNNYFKFE